MVSSAERVQEPEKGCGCCQHLPHDGQRGMAQSCISGASGWVLGRAVHRQAGWALQVAPGEVVTAPGLPGLTKQLDSARRHVRSLFSLPVQSPHLDSIVPMGPRQLRMFEDSLIPQKRQSSCAQIATNTALK